MSRLLLAVCLVVSVAILDVAGAARVVRSRLHHRALTREKLPRGDVYNPITTMTGEVSSPNGWWQLTVEGEDVWITSHSMNHWIHLSGMDAKKYFSAGLMRMFLYSKYEYMTGKILQMMGLDGTEGGQSDWWHCGLLSIEDNGEVRCTESNRRYCGYATCADYERSARFNYSCEAKSTESKCSTNVINADDECDTRIAHGGICSVKKLQETMAMQQNAKSWGDTVKNTRTWSMAVSYKTSAGLELGPLKFGSELAFTASVGGSVETTTSTSETNTFTRTVRDTAEVSSQVSNQDGKERIVRVSEISTVCSVTKTDFKCHYPAIEKTVELKFASQFTVDERGLRIDIIELQPPPVPPKDVCEKSAVPQSELDAGRAPTQGKPWVMMGTEGRVYRSTELTRREDDFFKNKAPGTGKTLQELFQLYMDKDCPMYPQGGAVRDLVVNVPPKDVDIVFSCTAEQAEWIAKQANIKVERKGTLIRWGEPEQGNALEQVEGVQWNKVKTENYLTREHPVNDLVYDPYNHWIYDLSAVGFERLCGKTQVIAPRVLQGRKTKEWLGTQSTKAPRWWKLVAAPRSLTTDISESRMIADFMMQCWKSTARCGVGRRKWNYDSGNTSNQDSFLRFICNRIGRGDLFEDEEPTYPEINLMEVVAGESQPRCRVSKWTYWLKLQAYKAAVEQTWTIGLGGKYKTFWEEEILPVFNRCESTGTTWHDFLDIFKW